jgi:hypothetical protein
MIDFYQPAINNQPNHIPNNLYNNDYDDDHDFSPQATSISIAIPDPFSLPYPAQTRSKPAPLRNKDDLNWPSH